jgi:preprotein translocase subunit SecA
VQSLFPITGIQKALDQAQLKRWWRLVRKVEKLDATLQPLSDADLVKKSLALRYEAQSGTPLDNLTVEAFALVREAARRSIGMQHYPVQLLGGFAMHFGSIAVMQTGEGKTLTATLPIYTAALAGRGAHLATANDYLAARDAKLMRPVFAALGMTVGVIESETSRADRATQYAADITYSTAKEIGFDFLRDRLANRRSQFENNQLIDKLVTAPNSRADNSPTTVQRDLNFMLVDEADSILIDEARTPLIVSSLPDEVAKAKIELYRWCASVADRFDADSHYTHPEKSKAIELTADGRQHVRTLPKPELLARTPLLDMYDQIEQAVFVQRNYVRDRQYVIRDDEVVIVDEFTGRLAEGRKWRAGLHQAIEAAEGLEVSVETGESARITIQDLFLKYDQLAGMTGTAANSAVELKKIYHTRVVNVPTNKPPRRHELPVQVFASDNEKWSAIVTEIIKVRDAGRPVLIGTRSIDKSQILSDLLAKHDVPHDVLNANNLAREAEIVAAAGDVGRVVVATNMAGRGTDIKVTDAALNNGGLHVICTEVHESSRIDRQLIGRCGRQGDPGSFRQFVSLEDEILEQGMGTDKAEKLRGRHVHSAHQLTRLSKLFHLAQRKIERKHFQGRRMLLHQEKLRHEMQKEMGQDPYLDTAGA